MRARVTLLLAALAHAVAAAVARERRPGVGPDDVGEQP
jgi:hypothetical protein